MFEQLLGLSAVQTVLWFKTNNHRELGVWGEVDKDFSVVPAGGVFLTLTVSFKRPVKHLCVLLGTSTWKILYPLSFLCSSRQSPKSQTKSLDFVLVDGGLIHAWQERGAQRVLISLLPFLSPPNPFYHSFTPYHPSLLYLLPLFGFKPFLSVFDASLQSCKQLGG